MDKQTGKLIETCISTLMTLLLLKEHNYKLKDLADLIAINSQGNVLLTDGAMRYLLEDLIRTKLVSSYRKNRIDFYKITLEGMKTLEMYPDAVNMVRSKIMKEHIEEKVR